MIPKEKIEQAAIDYCHYPDRLMFKIGFQSGVSFAETELKSIAMEFAEWRDFNSWKSDYIEQKNHTTAELFYKFMEERSAK